MFAIESCRCVAPCIYMDYCGISCIHGMLFLLFLLLSPIHVADGLILIYCDVVAMHVGSMHDRYEMLHCYVLLDILPSRSQSGFSPSTSISIDLSYNIFAFNILVILIGNNTYFYVITSTGSLILFFCIYKPHKSKQIGVVSSKVNENFLEIIKYPLWT
jgi:hypothetical protein